MTQLCVDSLRREIESRPTDGPRLQLDLPPSLGCHSSRLLYQQGKLKLMTCARLN